MPVRFFNEGVAFRLYGKSLIKNWVVNIIRCKKQIPGEINIIFCSDRYLLKLNQSYLHHNTLTDIITFDYSEKKSTLISGDIFISIPRVKENALKFNCPLQEETHRVVIHGILHLLGWNDKTVTEKKAMRKIESQCLLLRPLKLRNQ